MIGEVPIGYEDLVEMWFAVGRALETICYSTHVSTCSTPNNTEKLLLTRGREVPQDSGKVTTRNHRLAAHNGGSQGNPRCNMSWECLSPV